VASSLTVIEELYIGDRQSKKTLPIKKGEWKQAIEDILNKDTFFQTPAYVFSPKGVREQLEPKVLGAGLKWGEYNSDLEKVTSELIKGGVVVKVIPLLGKRMDVYTSEGVEEHSGILTYQMAWEKIAEILYNLEPNKSLIIGEGFFPPSENLNKTRNTFPLTPVRRDSRYKDIPVQDATRATIEQFTVDRGNIGIDTTGSDGKYTVYTLIDLLRAPRIVTYILDQIKEGKLSQPKISFNEKGKLVVDSIPSILSGEPPYVVVFDRFPKEGSINSGYTFRTFHRCKRKDYDEEIHQENPRAWYRFNLKKEGREGPEFIVCHHDLAALKLAMPYLDSQNADAVYPFPEFSDEFNGLYDKLNSSVLIEDSEGRRRPMRLTEMEYALWHQVRYSNITKKPVFRN
jgi:hypothetical protein